MMVESFATPLEMEPRFPFFPPLPLVSICAIMTPLPAILIETKLLRRPLSFAVGVCWPRFPRHLNMSHSSVAGYPCNMVLHVQSLLTGEPHLPRACFVERFNRMEFVLWWVPHTVLIPNAYWKGLTEPSMELSAPMSTYAIWTGMNLVPTLHLCWTVPNKQQMLHLTNWCTEGSRYCPMREHSELRGNSRTALVQASSNNACCMPSPVQELPYPMLGNAWTQPLLILLRPPLLILMTWWWSDSHSGTKL